MAIGSWLGAGVQWLNHNSDAILALCGLGGLACSVIGVLVNNHYKSLRDDRDQERLDIERHDSD